MIRFIVHYYSYIESFRSKSQPRYGAEFGNWYCVPDLRSGVGVEVEVGGRVGAAGEFLEGQGADHGRVVGAKLRGGPVGVEAGLPGEVLEARPQSRVAGDTAAENERPGQDRIGGQAEVVDKGPGDDILEAGQEIGQPRIA